MNIHSLTVAVFILGAQEACRADRAASLPQDCPRGPKDAPRSLQDIPPEGPRTCPISLGKRICLACPFSEWHQRPSGPCGPQKRPNTAQEAPQEGRKTAQESPNTVQEAPKTAQEGPRRGNSN